MTLTKSSTVVHNDITLTAGAGDTTSSTQDLSGKDLITARIRFTNGGTGPTVAAQCSIQMAEVDTAAKFIELTSLDGGTDNSGVSEYVVSIPPTANQLRFVSGSNTGQDVTLRVVIDTNVYS